MKVLLGLSGGVDSSVAAFLLKQEGFEVTAGFMRNWEDDDGSPYCSVKEDFMDAAQVADKLSINLGGSVRIGIYPIEYDKKQILYKICL